MKRTVHIIPAALAVGILFTLFGPFSVFANPLRDAAAQAKAELENAEALLEQRQQAVAGTEAQIDALTGRAAEVQSQLESVYAALQEAQNALQAAEQREAEAAAAVAERQAAYDALLEECMAQLAAMQRLRETGRVALLSEAKSLFQLLTFSRTLDQLSAANDELLTQLREEAEALERERQKAEAEAAAAEAARADLAGQQAALDGVLQELAGALQTADETLSGQQAEADAQAMLVVEKKKAYEKAAAALDASLRAQSDRYTPDGLHCSLDFRRPLDSYSYISTYFGAPDPWGTPHRGTDFAAPNGTPIYAAGDGVVIVATAHNSWGNYVSISHGKDDAGRSYRTLYAHMSGYCVSAGQTVRRGDLIGYVGNTGNVYGANGGYHLHLELFLDGALCDPLALIPT